jgi:hypothetical protein
LTIRKLWRKHTIRDKPCRESNHPGKAGSGSGRDWPVVLIKSDMVAKQQDSRGIYSMLIIKNIYLY